MIKQVIYKAQKCVFRMDRKQSFFKKLLPCKNHGLLIKFISEYNFSYKIIG